MKRNEIVLNDWYEHFNTKLNQSMMKQINDPKAILSSLFPCASTVESIELTVHKKKQDIMDCSYLSAVQSATRHQQRWPIKVISEDLTVHLHHKHKYLAIHSFIHASVQ